MGVVNHQHDLIFLTQLDDLWQPGDAAFHAEDAIDHHHFADIRIKMVEDALQISRIVMTEFQRLAKRQTTAIDDAGMILAVGQNKFAFCQPGQKWCPGWFGTPC